MTVQAIYWQETENYNSFYAIDEISYNFVWNVVYDVYMKFENRIDSTAIWNYNFCCAKFILKVKLDVTGREKKKTKHFVSVDVVDFFFSWSALPQPSKKKNDNISLHMTNQQFECKYYLIKFVRLLNQTKKKITYYPELVNRWLTVVQLHFQYIYSNFYVISIHKR